MLQVRHKAQGRPLATGANLAVVLRYARKSPVESVRLDCSVERRGEYAVTFYFANGAECFTYWADWRVLLNWLCARRSWRIERLLVASTGPAIPPRHPALGRLRERGAEVRLLNYPLPL